jgi:hypothetical protein
MDDFYVTSVEAEACVLAAEVMRRHIADYLLSCERMGVHCDARWVVERMSAVDGLQYFARRGCEGNM